jgi:hypothetical protein
LREKFSRRFKLSLHIQTQFASTADGLIAINCVWRLSEGRLMKRVATAIVFALCATSADAAWNSPTSVHDTVAAAPPVHRVASRAIEDEQSAELSRQSLAMLLLLRAAHDQRQAELLRP